MWACRLPTTQITAEDFLAEANVPARNAAYEFNGHTYHTDDLTRTRLIEGDFAYNPVGRNDPGLQRRIGYSGYDADVGFHLVPDFAGAGNLSRGPDRIVVRHRLNGGEFEQTIFENKH